ncbi:GNAT family N-acetyltransferase [Shewanella sp. NIFS-20-20]|uniref:GNAT family N-acetyltransferase n=1 Tax=Shewanella sp. NIFS-20-20 TaxID=2853806 RepID=UPI001C43D6D7|nr:GNAT family N-acetyltransferase [Shewanella sp. NIFS-20-20]MBV7316954.1 GNAT family N-acetyltransferase [Shewanella sp. NIFS-20-20]
MWKLAPFDQLSVQTLYQLLKLRVDVFVVEQACAYPELDGKDMLAEARHLWFETDDGDILAYARILPAGAGYDHPAIGRVIVASAARGLSLGQQLMKQAIGYCQQAWPHTPIDIGAQHYLLTFYQGLGFTPISEVYLEDDIPHIDMRRLP